MAKSRSKSSYKNKSHRKHGGDASNWVTSVVGNYPHSAQSGSGSNVIQQHAPMSGGGVADTASPIGNVVNNNVPNAIGSAHILETKHTLSGGKKRSNKRKGGNVLSELAVPAVLLFANQTFNRKTGKNYPYSRKRFSRRYRKGRK